MGCSAGVGEGNPRLPVLSELDPLDKYDMFNYNELLWDANIFFNVKLNRV
jgi:hypothetical protein